MKENHPERPPGTDPGRVGKKRNGSPHEPTCTTTGSGKTAKKTLARKEINPSDPVPLYLVPQMVGAAVRRFGRHILEIRVSTAPGHTYTVTVRTQEEGEAA
ncbi:MAG TPA: hypothetical protein ENN52_01910 [Methanofollis liminatans]|uniref:Uncharacterized protein n=1 Tax=Methanofollis liminatans TaxID=2201 RepID=A0A831LEL5_9EURY|nr:hypothetical protein [Methanofollis liminatans]